MDPKRKIVRSEIRKIFDNGPSVAELEKTIFDIFRTRNVDYSVCAYEAIGIIQNALDKGVSSATIPQIIATELPYGESAKPVPIVGFESSAFDDIRRARQLENARIINPPKLKKGGFKCKKCGSTNTWSYQLQTRSSDEPMTTFVICDESKCGTRYTIRG